MTKKESLKVGLDVSRNSDVKSSFIKDKVGKDYISDDNSTGKIDTLITSALTSKQNGLCLKLADDILHAFPKKEWNDTIIHLDVKEVVLPKVKGEAILWYRDFSATMTLTALNDKIIAYRLIQDTIEGYHSKAVINHRSFKPGSSKPEASNEKVQSKPKASWLPSAKKEPKPKTAKIEVIQ